MSILLAQLGSAFIAPALAGAGALAIAVPIAIHLLSRLRRKRERWGAMRFLRLAYQQQKNKMRLEQWLLLLTRCLLVALIGLALAGPVLSGAWANWWGGLLGTSGAGRTVHVVVDDALSSGVVENTENQSETSRLDALRAEASAWIDATGRGDRLVLWSTADPSSLVAVSEAGQPRGALVAALEGMEPGYGGADWEGVVAAVSEDVLRGLSGAASGGDVVAVVSGFARGGGALEEPASSGVGDVGGATGALRRLGDVASVVLTRPAAARPNVQVVSATPRRAAVLVTDGDDGGEVEVRVVVRRFGDTAESALAALRVELLGLQAPTDAEAQATIASVSAPGLIASAGPLAGEALGSAQREVRFGVGQDTATVSVPVRWSAGALDVGVDALSAMDLGLRATLVQDDAPAGNRAVDALPADDVSYGLVRVLRRLRVGIQGGDTSGDGVGLGPAVFVRSALSAGLDERALDVFALPADDGVALAAQLEEDAEPVDALFVLSPSRVGRGGWSAIGAWARRGGLGWVLPDASADAGGSGGWASAMSLGLNTETTFTAVSRPSEAATPRVGEAAPEALLSLSGEWDALLGPVRASAWRVVRPGGEAQTWIALRGATQRDSEAGLATPWLVQQPLEAGTLLLLGSSLDATWTNLPAKPLFPALMQEALRHALAPRVPARTFAWDDRPTVDVRSAMAINVQADAGDTSALTDAALSAWWSDAVGDWSYVPSAEQGGVSAVLSTGAPSVPLSRYLLWVVLALVVVESLLSRRFSHATTNRPAVTGRLSAWLNALRHGKTRVAS